MPRALLAQVLHETNTFSIQPAGLDAFRQRELLEGAAVVDALQSTNSEIGGFIAGGRARGWDLLPVIATEATPCGMVAADAWDLFRDRIVATAAAATTTGRLDAVLLALHGAMVTTADRDADASLAMAVRAVAGADCLIGCTLDLHANVSDRLAQAVNILVPFESYPHTDMRERGVEVVELAAHALAEGRVPRSFVFRNRQLDGCDQGRSTGEIMPQLKAMAKHARVPGRSRVGICAGFPWADVPHAGPSVIVTGSLTATEAADLAGPLLERIWETRARSSLAALDPEAACRAACELTAAGRRVLIADFSDNPGGGGYGTRTALLAALLKRELPPTVVAPICDPQAVARCANCVPGSRVELSVGGVVDRPFGGPPLRLEGELRHCGDVRFVARSGIYANRELRLGPTVVIRCRTVDVIITSFPLQVTDPTYISACGVDFEGMRIIAIKSMQHFRTALEPLVDDILFADTGGLVSNRYSEFPYRHVRRPIWPLDPAADRQ
jgi:microcystin degradation protein MlrC